MMWGKQKPAPATSPTTAPTAPASASSSPWKKAASSPMEKMITGFMGVFGGGGGKSPMTGAWSKVVQDPVQRQERADAAAQGKLFEAQKLEYGTLQNEATLGARAARARQRVLSRGSGYAGTINTSPLGLAGSSLLGTSSGGTGRMALGS